ncbi:hypothetical protein LUZ60_017304 [Juncus effusus]|nr:hypothetical protein LUZ60_017304 [Juncus effusus]
MARRPPPSSQNASLSNSKEQSTAMEKNVTVSGKPKHSMDVNRSNGKLAASKGSGQRSAATVRRLKMYKQKPIRNNKGQILKHDLQSKELPNTRVQPDRRWFGNTRVVNQKELELFREEVQKHMSDQYTVILKKGRILPHSLVNGHQKQAKSHVLETEPFEYAFGPKGKRKRPKLLVPDYESLLKKADNSQAGGRRGHTMLEKGKSKRIWGEAPMFEKGQSKRIWGELYKVVDSSDVVVQVLDARDPQGTRCFRLEKHLKEKCAHKLMVLLLNKCDLVPAWVTKGWLRVLSKEYPTLAFHASITKSFGKDSLLSVLRQFARLKSDKQAISVGFVGYPNVGKSSVINTLCSKSVCNVAPIPGETKVWQYITLTKRIFLIDCPGVVYHNHDSETDIVLKGVVRVTNLKDASEHIGEVLKRVKKEHLQRAYKINDWTDDEDFLVQMSKATGKLLKGGEADIMASARAILHDWQRGKIPFFVPPPQQNNTEIETLNPNDNKEDENTEIETLNPNDNEEDEEIMISTDKMAAAMKAIAGIISSQQEMNVPSKKEFSNDDGGNECSF